MSVSLLIQKILSLLILPLSVIWWLDQLSYHLPCLRRCGVAVINAHMTNFGVAVVGIDTSRRVLAGRHAAFGLIWEPGSTHNPMLRVIWPDIEILLLRRPNVVFTLLGRKIRLPVNEILVPVLDAVTRAFMALAAPKTELLLRRDVFSAVKIPPELADKVPQDRDGPPMEAIMNHGLWAGMLSRIPAGRLRLPEDARSMFHGKLVAARNGRKARLCMFFNRLDETGEGHPRNGSPMEAYLPAIRLLVDRGFQVMLVGDRTLDQEAMDAFDGMVVDVGFLGVDKDLFRMFVPTEADIAIGDSGAGMLLPMIVGMPSLVLNSYPISVVPVGTFVFPKRLIDPAGEHILFDRIFSEDPHGNYNPDKTNRISSIPLPNTEADITEAVKSFLDDPTLQDETPVGHELVSLLPEECIFRQSGAMLSPAFVRRYL